MYVHLLLKKKKKKKRGTRRKENHASHRHPQYQDRAPLTIEYAKTPIPMESSGIRPEAGE